MSKGRKFLEELGVCWATFFYVGRSPKAPGTCGSLAAMPLAWAVWTYLPTLYGWAFTLFVLVTGTVGAGVVGRRSGNSDDQTIVIDEVLGILITTSVVTGPYWPQYLFAFLLFRLFDIWKPWPVRWVDRKWKTALGTMMDDALAAVLAAAVLFAMIRFWDQMRNALVLAS